MTDPCRKDEHTDLIRRLREEAEFIERHNRRLATPSTSQTLSVQYMREAAATIESLERSLTEADEALIWATNQWVAGKDGADAYVQGRKVLVPAYDAAKARRGKHQ
jgi:hypothetical protein